MTARSLHILVVFVNRVLGLVNLKITRKIAVVESLVAGMERDVARKFFWMSVYSETKHLPGDIAEFGVAEGTGLVYWLNVKKQFSDGCRLWAFDSFKGFPAGTEGKDSPWFLALGNKAKPQYKKFTLPYVKENLRQAGFADQDFENEVTFVCGYIPQSLGNVNLKKIKLANLDLDLYQGTHDALNFVWPRMVKGGIVIFDEYDSEADLRKWPGSKRAVDEFCESTGAMLHRHFTGRVYLVK